MATVIFEYVQSRTFAIGRRQERELVYRILDAADEDEALTALDGAAPAAYKGLVRERLEAKHVGGDVWEAFASYEGFDDDEVSFDTGGGTAHITQALSTIASYAPPGMTAPNTQGAIGATGGRVEGTDITVPAYTYSETHRFTDSFVQAGYRAVLFNLTGTVCDAPFKDFAAGEGLFLGASGSKRGDEDWSINFRFAGSPNQTGLSIGDITGISKLGWDLLDIAYADFEDSFSYSIVQRPIGVQVQRVYRFGSWADLAIGT